MAENFFTKYMTEDFSNDFDDREDEENNAWAANVNMVPSTNSKYTAPSDLHDLSNHHLLHQEYTKLIETNHSLAEQYSHCQREKVKLFKENESLKQSLTECEAMLRRKMESDHETWSEMETVHYELSQKLKSTESELKRARSVIETQKERIELLQSKFSKSNEEHESAEQREQILRNDIALHREEVQSLREELRQSQHHIFDQQSTINEMHSEQIQQKQDRSVFVKDIQSNNDLDGCLASTLEILHEAIHQALPPRIVLLWKKWIYALMQHFENKLVALKQTQRQIRDLPLRSMVATDSADSITFYEPRVVVKYKKESKRSGKRSKGRAHSQSVRKSKCHNRRGCSQSRKYEIGTSPKRKIRRSQTLKKTEQMVKRKQLNRFRF